MRMQPRYFVFLLRRLFICASFRMDFNYYGVYTLPRGKYAGKTEFEKRCYTLVKM